MDDYASDGRFPDGSVVLVWYPPAGADAQDRASWAWLPGSVLSQCGPDEWQVCVEVREVAVLEDGSPAPDGAPEDHLLYPIVFRDSSELRPANGEDVS